MATDLDVCIYQGAGVVAHGAILFQDVLNITNSPDQTVAMTVGAENIGLIARLQPDTACRVLIGIDAVASATAGFRMVAGSTEYKDIQRGERVSTHQL